jgi:hypothetical protein
MGLFCERVNFFEETTAFQKLLPLSGTCFRVVYVLVKFRGKRSTFIVFNETLLYRRYLTDLIHNQDLALSLSDFLDHLRVPPWLEIMAHSQL